MTGVVAIKIDCVFCIYIVIKMPKGVYERKTEAQRFWEKVNQSEDANACCDWMGSVDGDGYGWFSFKSETAGKADKSQTGKTIHAHRYSAILKFGAGEIEGKLVRHTCDRPICVNPTHLILGTHADNSADMTERNRQAVGEKRPQANLTDAQAKEVLVKYAKAKEDGTLYGALERLAKKYSCPKQAIYRITSRQTYRHIVI